jgi:acyl carrier protein
MPATSIASATPATFGRVAAILEHQFHVGPELIGPDLALADTGLDSLALMEFVFAVEDEFAVRLPEERLDPRDGGLTLGHLCEVLDEETREASGPGAATGAVNAALSSSTTGR